MSENLEKIEKQEYDNMLDAHEKLKEYSTSLERQRADLWGVNEELRTKIGALEWGMDDLLELQDDVKIFENALIKIKQATGCHSETRNLASEALNTAEYNRAIRKATLNQWRASVGLDDDGNPIGTPQ